MALPGYLVDEMEIPLGAFGKEITFFGPFELLKGILGGIFFPQSVMRVGHSLLPHPAQESPGWFSDSVGAVLYWSPSSAVGSLCDLG